MKLSSDLYSGSSAFDFGIEGDAAFREVARTVIGLAHAVLRNQRLYRMVRCDFGHTSSPQISALELSIRPPRPRPYLRWFPVLSDHCPRVAPGLESRDTIMLGI